MNNIIGALIVSLAISGSVPADVSTDTEDNTAVAEVTETMEQTEAETAEEAQLTQEEILSNAENLNYDHDIASYTTNYSTSSSNYNRNFNMQLACDAINGEIIMPGEEFSYNETILAKRDPNNDYKSAGVISGGKLVNSIGGGICQVSSTLYNAALYSGMTITQRRNHSLKVSYLPAGRDATCSWGTIDFCFRNDLELPVKIEATMDNGTMKIRFLSPGDPGIGDIDIQVVNNNGTYTLYRYVDGVVDYTATSRYSG
ncbi:MAG: VanW family protein [Clostridiales bacterium]|nr:VanW family protein [Clostridiales bacterium]